MSECRRLRAEVTRWASHPSSGLPSRRNRVLTLPLLTTGEAVLCSYRKEEGSGLGWGVLCFVPGPDG